MFVSHSQKQDFVLVFFEHTHRRDSLKTEGQFAEFVKKSIGLEMWILP